MSDFLIALGALLTLFLALAGLGAIARRIGPKANQPVSTIVYDADHGRLAPLSTYDRDKERAESRTAWLKANYPSVLERMNGMGARRKP